MLDLFLARAACILLIGAWWGRAVVASRSTGPTFATPACVYWLFLGL